MKKYLVITIDVEPDCSPSWRYSDPLSFNGIKEGVANRLQPLFNKYDITPTYLINNVALEDRESIQIFKELPGNYELGTHLHPEFIEPQKTHTHYAGKKGEANCCFYDPGIEFEKISSITRLFGDSFGYQPLSFRAGRFSAGANTIQSLIKLDYTTDTSVTPTVIWDDHTREQPVDFREAPQQPYFLDPALITRPKSGSSFLEAPVSITLKKLSIKDYIKHVVKKKRIPYKGSRSVWLRPVFSGLPDFIYIMDQLNEKYAGEKFVVYNMMFHNVEVMPGLSPYAATEEDCKNYLTLLESLFRYCKINNIQSSSLSGLHEIYRK